MSATAGVAPRPAQDGAPADRRAPLPALPALVTGTVSHRRLRPKQHGFANRVYSWLVDLDELPQLPAPLRPFACFDARDHLGSGETTNRHGSAIKDNVERFLGHHGVELGPGGRVLMLANARVLGHVFNPITVYWCYTGQGLLRCVVAEVHNTYGERHAYLLTPGPGGTARVDKQFYVSPFNDLSGEYALRFALEPTRVGVHVTLVRDGAAVLDTSFVGVPRPATAGRFLRTLLRRPLMPLRVSALIRVHGVWLWLRRLPLVPRPTHRPPEGV